MLNLLTFKYVATDGTDGDEDAALAMVGLQDGIYPASLVFHVGGSREQGRSYPRHSRRSI
jgi:hypothetical protein